jgi:hypothetical protein
MTKRVRGYPVPIHAGPFSRRLPQGAELLSVHPDNRGAPHLWALVDPHASHEERNFLLVMNGADIEGRVRFIATFTVRGAIVAHLFEIIKQPD